MMISLNQREREKSLRHELKKREKCREKLTRKRDFNSQNSLNDCPDETGENENIEEDRSDNNVHSEDESSWDERNVGLDVQTKNSKEEEEDNVNKRVGFVEDSIEQNEKKDDVINDNDIAEDVDCENQNLGNEDAENQKPEYDIVTNVLKPADGDEFGENLTGTEPSLSLKEEKMKSEKKCKHRSSKRR